LDGVKHYLPDILRTRVAPIQLAGCSTTSKKGMDRISTPVRMLTEVDMIYKIILVKIDHRSTEAVKVQSILTDFGCNIKVRLGLHEVSKEFCANDGLIVLEVEGDKHKLNRIVAQLNKVEYVEAKLIEM
jgi:hypothetical protein